MIVVRASCDQSHTQPNLTKVLYASIIIFYIPGMSINQRFNFAKQSNLPSFQFTLKSLLKKESFTSITSNPVHLRPFKDINRYFIPDYALRPFNRASSLFYSMQIFCMYKIIYRFYLNPFVSNLFF